MVILAMFGSGLGLALSPVHAAGTVGAAAPMDVAAPADGNFVPLPQAPLVDTRSGLGLPANPITGGTTYGVQVAGKSGVPSTGVSAIALSVTTTNSTTSSQLTVYPAGQATRPGTATTISAAGDNRQNSAYIALGTDGKVWVYIDRGSTDLVIAVTGYFSTADTGAGFTTVAQTRLVDTRNGTGVPQAKIPSGGSVTFSVASAGVPTTAKSLAFNFTVISPNNGYLNAGPATGSSTLYTGVGFADGSLPIANAAFVQMNSARTIKIINNAASPIDVIVDIFGYFGSSGMGGGFTADQARVYDSLTTPPTPVPAGGTVYVKLLGQGGIPSQSVGAVAVTLTTTAQTSSGYLRTYDPDNTEPSVGSSLNYQAGDIISNSAIVQPSSPDSPAANHPGAVAIHNVSSGTIRLVVDVQGWFAPYTDTYSVSYNAGRNFTQAAALAASVGGTLAEADTTFGAGDSALTVGVDTTAITTAAQYAAAVDAALDTAESQRLAAQSDPSADQSLPDTSAATLAAAQVDSSRYTMTRTLIHAPEGQSDNLMTQSGMTTGPTAAGTAGTATTVESQAIEQPPAAFGDPETAPICENSYNPTYLQINAFPYASQAPGADHTPYRILAERMIWKAGSSRLANLTECHADNNTTIEPDFGENTSDGQTYFPTSGSPVSWSSNLPEAYLDTDFLDGNPITGGGPHELTIGSSDATKLVPGREYFSYFTETAGNSATSTFGMAYQRGHRLPPTCRAHTWCVEGDNTHSPHAIPQGQLPGVTTVAPS